MFTALLRVGAAATAAVAVAKGSPAAGKKWHVCYFQTITLFGSLTST